MILAIDPGIERVGWSVINVLPYSPSYLSPVNYGILNPRMMRGKITSILNEFIIDAIVIEKPV